MCLLRYLNGRTTSPVPAEAGQLKLLKIGALIRITVRKVWVSPAGGYPYVALFQQVLRQAVHHAGKVLKKNDREQLFPRFYRAECQLRARTAC